MVMLIATFQQDLSGYIFLNFYGSISSSVEKIRQN